MSTKSKSLFPKKGMDVLVTLGNGLTETTDLETNCKEKNQEDISYRPPKWHPDEIHCNQLCENCLRINYYWPFPPRPYPPLDEKDPNLIYPGDEDPNFNPSRGDILIVHPKGLGSYPSHKKPSLDDLWWKSKRIGGGFCISYDGDSKFKFEVGDLVLRIGSFQNEERINDLQTGNMEEPKGTKSRKSLADESLNMTEDMQESKGIKSKKRRGSKDIIMEMEKPKEGKTTKHSGSKTLDVDTKASKHQSKTSKEVETIYPPISDEWTYNPYDKLELYICSGLELLKEEVPIDVARLELELSRVFEANTNYTASMGPKDEQPISTKNANFKLKTSTVDDSNKVLDDKDESCRDRVMKQAETGSFILSQTKLQAPEIDKITKSRKDQEPPTAKSTRLIWTFLGGQSKLHMDPHGVSLNEPKCPRLECFYQPYLNLGSKCKMDHTSVPNLGEILIPKEVWFRNFNHRMNKWKSMGKWFLPTKPPTLKPREEKTIQNGRSDEESLKHGLGSKKIVIDEGNGKKEKGGKKGKNGKAPKEDRKDDAANQDKDNVENGESTLTEATKRKSRTEKLNKDEIKLENHHGDSPPRKDRADKAIQVLDIEEPKNEFNDTEIPLSPLKEEITPGMILIRPFVGRQLKDVDPPIEEWKWPKKQKVWGAVEMYMAESGGEGLEWVYWGKSDRICDTPFPVSPPEAKLKFLHPLDVNINTEMGESPCEKVDNNLNPNEIGPNERIEEIEEGLAKKQSNEGKKEESKKKSKKEKMK